MFGVFFHSGSRYDLPDWKKQSLHPPGHLPFCGIQQTIPEPFVFGFSMYVLIHLLLSLYSLCRLLCWETTVFIEPWRRYESYRCQARDVSFHKRANVFLRHTFREGIR